MTLARVCPKACATRTKVSWFFFSRRTASVVGTTIMTSLKKGEHVTWSSPQGKIDGEVVRTVTSTTSVKGHTARATKDEPQVLVKSAKTGKTALHKPEAIKKA
jgi:hypothetical protein